jgi:hypothetical protein
VAAGSEGPTPSSTERDAQDVLVSNGGISNGNMTPQDTTEPPLSPSVTAPGLSMNAFGRPKMTVAAVGAEEMDVDDPLIPETSSRAADDED